MIEILEFFGGIAELFSGAAEVTGVVAETVGSTVVEVLGSEATGLVINTSELVIDISTGDKKEEIK